MSDNPGVRPDASDSFSRRPGDAPHYGPASRYGSQSYGQPPDPGSGPRPEQASPYGQPPAYAWPAPDGQHDPGPLGELPPWGRRVGAYLIDFAPNLVAAIPFTIGYTQWLVAVARSAPGGSARLPDDGSVLMIVGVVLLLGALGWQIYNRWLTAGRTGQSVGKRILGITLVSEQTGQPIGAVNAFCRDLVHVLDSFAYVGYLWPLWDERRQTFSDKLMNTVVLTRPVLRTGR